MYTPRTITELEAQLDYERLRREKLEAQLDQYRRDMADLSYRLQAQTIDDNEVGTGDQAPFTAAIYNFCLFALTAECFAQTCFHSKHICQQKYFHF